MAKTFKNLYPKIYDPGNLWTAWRRARRGGKRKWAAVADFEFNLELNTTTDLEWNGLLSAR